MDTKVIGQPMGTTLGWTVPSGSDWKGGQPMGEHKVYYKDGVQSTIVKPGDAVVVCFKDGKVKYEPAYVCAIRKVSIENEDEVYACVVWALKDPTSNDQPNKTVTRSTRSKTVEPSSDGLFIASAKQFDVVHIGTIEAVYNMPASGILSNEPFRERKLSFNSGKWLDYQGNVLIGNIFFDRGSTTTTQASRKRKRSTKDLGSDDQDGDNVASPGNNDGPGQTEDEAHSGNHVATGGEGQGKDQEKGKGEDQEKGEGKDQEGGEGKGEGTDHVEDDGKGQGGSINNDNVKDGDSGDGNKSTFKDGKDDGEDEETETDSDEDEPDISFTGSHAFDSAIEAIGVALHPLLEVGTPPIKVYNARVEAVRAALTPLLDAGVAYKQIRTELKELRKEQRKKVQKHPSTAGQ